MSPVVISINTLMGYKVQNAAGEDLGRIEELVIDQSSSRVLYAVLASGGFLGVGNRLFAVPWTALHLNSHDKRFILNVDKETLRHAPSFDRNHWADFSDREFEERVETYFEFNPAEESQTATQPSASSTRAFRFPGQLRNNLNEPSEEFIGPESASRSIQSADEDSKLARRVEFELYSTRAFDLDAIEVTARDGIVLLTGRVGSRAESILALNTAQAVEGVRSVTNNLKVSKVA